MDSLDPSGFWLGPELPQWQSACPDSPYCWGRGWNVCRQADSYRTDPKRRGRRKEVLEAPSRAHYLIQSSVSGGGWRVRLSEEVMSGAESK